MNRRTLEVLVTFLRLGLTSFGGPIAHVAYFRDEVVVRQRWLDDDTFARLLALCQLLPGPASSQLGFALGRHHAGWAGGVAAFVAFTLPSALAMFAAAALAVHLGASQGTDTLVHGLKLVAVVVVAHGLWGMARTLTPDLRRMLIALLAAGLVLLWPGVAGQVGAIGVGALLGLFVVRATPVTAASSSGAQPAWRIAIIAAVLFGVGLVWSLWPRDGSASLAALAAAHYSAGSLVFGGGHVVLPLLESQLVGSGWIDADRFLAGYGAAQAVPGPMFTLASYLGAAVDTGHPPALASLVATLCVFLPGMLILVAALPYWALLSRHAGIAAAMAGVAAAVVGLLLATLYQPLVTSGIRHGFDVLIVVVGLVLCGIVRRPIVAVLPWCIVMSFLWQYGWPG